MFGQKLPWGDTLSGMVNDTVCMYNVIMLSLIVDQVERWKRKEYKRVTH